MSDQEIERQSNSPAETDQPPAANAPGPPPPDPQRNTPAETEQPPAANAPMPPSPNPPPPNTPDESNQPPATSTMSPRPNPQPNSPAETDQPPASATMPPRPNRRPNAPPDADQPPAANAMIPPRPDPQPNTPADADQPPAANAPMPPSPDPQPNSPAESNQPPASTTISSRANAQPNALAETEQPPANAPMPPSPNPRPDTPDESNQPASSTISPRPAPPDADQPPAANAPGPPPPEPQLNSPFWSYSDLFLFMGLAVPAMLAGFGLVRAVLIFFRLHPMRAAQLLMEQFAGYLFLSLVLLLIFRVHYGRPFWPSLGWRPLPAPPVRIVTAGLLTALAVVFAGFLIRTPTTSNPMMDLMQDRASIILIGIFGVTLGPLAEELAFRGFLQPLLVRSMGVLPGILVAALPFGLLHLPEYGYSWRHAVLICGAGAAFGWMRHATNSTKASTLMHGAYNALFFAALWGSKGQH